MPYAEKTRVPVEQSRGEIEKLVNKHKGRSFGYFGEKGRAIIVFEIGERRIRFDLPLPETNSKNADEKVTRSRWRALLLCIKAKLEAVESNIESFEEAFLAHVVMPDGETVGSKIKPQIDTAYKTNSMVPLLPSGKIARVKAE